MEREHRASVATFYAPGDWGDSINLSADAAHHARVKRLAEGDALRLTNGQGRRGSGSITSIGKSGVGVRVDEAHTDTEPVPQVDLLVPIGDRDRMLMVAEKCVELGASSWQAVSFARSRSVSPRGEGEAFHAKVLARQVSALEQSNSAWLPAHRPDITLDSLLATTMPSTTSRLLLDVDGERIADVVNTLTAPIAICLGPEGGLEEEERARLIQDGWRPVALGANVLRFETAAITALGIVRAHLG